MNSIELKQSYQEQLIKVGVDPLKAKRAAKTLSVEELQLIGDIWPDWANCITTGDREESISECLIQHEVHHSAFSKIKRLIDIAGALVGLILTAILFLPVAIAIKLDSPGPIFYCQTRCGLKGKPFKIYKFRTMVDDADKQQHLIKNEAEGYIFKNQNDPRVTRVGKFLRCTSLDEFPQFWNVLQGDMSLVGTRPPTPDEVKNYQNHHYKRLLVKPGITGQWQVYGRSIIKDFEQIVSMDLDYQQKWSLLYDISLILKTLGVVLIRKGAY
jgi:exopolysaccharide biosynthesis polyprenyl glycosylphosphotransferase